MSAVGTGAASPRARWIAWVATAVCSALPRDREGATLVLFAHPHCVCTRASLDELEVILSGHTRPVSAQVVFGRARSVSWPGSISSRS
jgi:hypothetical protein